MTTALARIVPFTLASALAVAAAGCSAPVDGDEGATHSDESVATAASALTVCASFDTASLAAYPTPAGTWQVADKNQPDVARFATKDLATRFITVATAYGFAQRCSEYETHAPNPARMEYMLTATGTVPPNVNVAYEACTTFNPAALQIAWSPGAQGYVLQADGVAIIPWSTDTAALEEMRATILAKGFVSKCVAGNPSAGGSHLEYWKVKPAAVLPIDVGTPGR